MAIHGRGLRMKVKKVFGGGGMIVCPRQRAKSLTSFHHERIHYARRGKVAVNAEERAAALCRYIMYKVIVCIPLK